MRKYPILGCEYPILGYGALMDAPDHSREAVARIGRNIAAHRQRQGPKGMSQEALAEKMRAAGWDVWRQSTVGKVEAAQRDLNAAEFADIARILGTTMDRLTWAQGEDAEHLAAGGALTRLRQAAEEAAWAVARLHAARAAARRASSDAARSSYPRVRSVAGAIDGELGDATLRNVLAEAWARWDHMRSGG